MKTYQIFRNVSVEYFVEAENVEDAYQLIYDGLVNPYSEEELSMMVSDVNKKGEWLNEKL